MNPEYNELEAVCEKLLRTYSLEELLEEGNVSELEALYALFEAGLMQDLPDEVLPC